MTTDRILARVYRFLEDSTLSPRPAQVRIWLSLTLLVTMVPATINLIRPFAGPYVIEHDAGKHLHWMQRFSDPALFPGDLVTDYYEAVTPVGVPILYWLTAQLGLDYATTTKLMVVVLALAAAYFAFKLCFELVPSATGAFIGATWLTAFIWLQKSVSSGGLRAYAIPLFVAFLYYLVRRSTIGTTLTIGLQAPFYPVISAVSAGVLVLAAFIWRDNDSRWPPPRRDLVRTVFGLAVVAIVLGVQLTGLREFGPPTDVDQPALQLENLYKAPGRPLVESDLSGLAKYFCGKNYFLLPFAGVCRGLAKMPAEFPWRPILLFGAFLLGPIVLVWLSRGESAPRPYKKVAVLLDVWIASLAGFFLAGAFLFQLHIPGRYTQYSLKVVVAIALGLLSALAAQYAFQLAHRLGMRWSVFGGIFAVALLAATIAGPALWVLHRGHAFPIQNFVHGRDAALYEFLAETPPDTLTASLARRVHMVPVFVFRPAFLAFDMPYSTGYRLAYDKRAKALLAAQYAPDLAPLQALIEEHGIDYLLVERGWAATDYLRKGWWMQYYPAESARLLEDLRNGFRPALASHMARCIALIEAEYALLDGPCLAAATDSEHDAAKRQAAEGSKAVPAQSMIAFEEVSKAAGIDYRGDSYGSSWGDIDGTAGPTSSPATTTIARRSTGTAATAPSPRLPKKSSKVCGAIGMAPRGPTTTTMATRTCWCPSAETGDAAPRV